MVLGVAKIGSSLSSVSSVRAALGVVHGPAAAAGEGAAGAAGAADGEPGEPGTFLGGHQAHTGPEDGPGGGSGGGCSGAYPRAADGGVAPPQPPPPPPAEAAGVGPDRGHGSRAATPAAAFLERAALPPPTLPERKVSRGNGGEGDKDLIPSLIRAVGGACCLLLQAWATGRAPACAQNLARTMTIYRLLDRLLEGELLQQAPSTAKQVRILSIKYWNICLY
jgi:hypothetical protein